MPTPHNDALENEFAKTVLMPGDPLRGKWIAETFLEQVKLVTSVRNMHGYTGLYKGKEVSVMGSGMGMPSMGIYSYELYKFYDVDTIIRVGSAGSYTEDLNLMDIVLAKRAYSESSYAIAQNGDDWMWGYPDRHINDKILKAAEEMDVPVTVGAIHSTDIFYRESTGKTGIGKIVRENELLCVEMEAFALFHNAKVLDKNAACLLTISNSFMKHEELTNKERETGFETMAVLALESVLKL